MIQSLVTKMLSAVALAALVALPAVSSAQRPGAQRSGEFTTQIQTQPQQRIAPTLQPPIGPDGHRHPLPRFGMHTFNNGYGEQVTRVRRGGLAWRLGLERGDVIVRLNRFSLTYRGAWWDALDRAMHRGGHVDLTIRDSRTGYLVKRHIDLDHELGWQQDLGQQHVVTRPITPPICGGPYPVEPDYPIGGPIGGPATPKFHRNGGQQYAPAPTPKLKREVPTARRQVRSLIGLASLLGR